MNNTFPELLWQFLVFLNIYLHFIWFWGRLCESHHVSSHHCMTIYNVQRNSQTGNLLITCPNFTSTQKHLFSSHVLLVYHILTIGFRILQIQTETHKRNGT
uniref:Uncharacterized protein n=1 Tax=Rhizophora mucronata TaxID=61149 RepID=A0A2P2P1H1_RHIMU